jgi:NIMA (never in mitosis gene a)-related kinase
MGCVLYEMLALKPPFKANDMDGLYKRIIAGKYPALPSNFSSDIANVIKGMLNTNPKMRPTCLTILTSESVKKRIEEYFSKDYLKNERLTFERIKQSVK